MAGSTQKLFALMKSLPRMGPETSPMTKFHSAVKTEESAARMETLRRHSPPVAMAVPVTDSSCGRGGPEAGCEQ